MKVPALLSRLKKLDSPELWLLLAFLAIWLIYKNGFAEGAQVFLGYIFILALMVFFIRAILALALRSRMFDLQQWALLCYAVAYPLLSLSLGWPVLFLAILGLASGLVVGVVVAISSPYTQWR
jgi:hypothetical protein